MKHYTNLLRGYGLALLSAALLFSCSQVDSFESADLLSEENESSLSSFNLTPFGSGLENARIYNDNSCGTECITTDPDSWFVQTLSQDYSANPAGSVTVKIFNSPTQIIYSITSTSDINRVDIGGSTVYASSTPAAQPFVHAINLGTWQGCDTRAAKVEVRRTNSSGTGGGVYLAFDTTYELVPVCPPVGCANNLSWVDNSDGTYTFTYKNTGAAITGASVVFTFAQGVVVSGLNDWSINGNTRQNNIDIVPGDNVFVVGLDVACGGVGQPNANLWTDFKINGESKKCDLSNIVKTCGS